jgi:hypothetical protein
MYPERHALRFVTYGALAAALTWRRPWGKLAAATGAAVYARAPVRRARSRITEPGERLAATIVVPALMAWLDTAKMAGYASGLLDRLRGRAA